MPDARCDHLGRLRRGRQRRRPAGGPAAGLPLLDRAISSKVAAQLHVSVPEAEGGAVRRSFIELLAPLAAGVLAAGPDAAPRDLAAPPNETGLFRDQAEAIMRAALVVRRRHPRPRGRRRVPGRARRAARPAVRAGRGAHRPGAPGSRARTPRRPGGACRRSTGARAQYVRRLYRADIDDPHLYHLHLDSTALPLDALRRHDRDRLPRRLPAGRGTRRRTRVSRLGRLLTARGEQSSPVCAG